MTDLEFADLERRLARALEGSPAPTPSAHAGAFRRDVLDLLAECRALRAELGPLREPPDVSGLLTAADLGVVLDRMAYNRPDTTDAGRDAWDADVRAVLAHAEASAALIRELYGVVADLHADDPGRQALLERGRAEGREQAARELERLADAEDALSPGATAQGQHFEVVEHTFVGRGFSRGADAVSALGPCRPPPLPPSGAEREAERLGDALRDLARLAGSAADLLADAGVPGWAGALGAAAAAAREALGEVPT